MILIFIISLIATYYVGRWVGLESEGSGQGFKEFMLAICLAMTWLAIGLHGSVYVNTHPLWGYDKPDFYNHEHVVLPDGSSGKIQDVYYLVEDRLYPQDSLKISK
tara:strand:+ start:1705 stop:2019 length:315 start_codon:yes stop_codon:yes gene_type:complete